MSSHRHFLAAGMAVLCAALISSAAAQGWAVPQPSPGLMPNPVQGKPLYVQHCAECHGDRLQGTDKGPPMLHKVYEPSHHADMAFQLAVANGVRAHHWKFGNMPPQPGLTRADVATIVAYVRELQRANGIN